MKDYRCIGMIGVPGGLMRGSGLGYNKNYLLFPQASYNHESLVTPTEVEMKWPFFSTVVHGVLECGSILELPRALFKEPIEEYIWTTKRES